ncbi:MAG: C40 family peptidase, partial [Pseudomonadota bacterium]|nr:C40 family peptidase [Pseudomonadota bacterium]
PSRRRAKMPADTAHGNTAHVDSARGDPRIERALGALGTRYRYGGNTPESGFDCSGFVRWIYQEIAGQLPRSAHALSQVKASEVERDALQPGDVLFFRINRSRAITHVGMYVGNGQFIHAPSSGGRVRVESVQAPYWRARLVKARRWALPDKSASSLLHENGIACVADDTACLPARPRLGQLNPQPFVGELWNSQWNPTPASASFSS